MRKSHNTFFKVEIMFLVEILLGSVKSMVIYEDAIMR